MIIVNLNYEKCVDELHHPFSSLSETMWSSPSPLLHYFIRILQPLPQLSKVGVDPLGAMVSHLGWAKEKEYFLVPWAMRLLHPSLFPRIESKQKIKQCSQIQNIISITEQRMNQLRGSYNQLGATPTSLECSNSGPQRESKEWNSSNNSPLWR